MTWYVATIGEGLRSHPFTTKTEAAASLPIVGPLRCRRLRPGLYEYRTSGDGGPYYVGRLDELAIEGWA